MEGWGVPISVCGRGGSREGVCPGRDLGSGCLIGSAERKVRSKGVNILPSSPNLGIKKSQKVSSSSERNILRGGLGGSCRRDPPVCRTSTNRDRRLTSGSVESKYPCAFFSVGPKSVGTRRSVRSQRRGNGDGPGLFDDLRVLRSRETPTPVNPRCGDGVRRGGSGRVGVGGTDRRGLILRTRPRGPPSQTDRHTAVDRVLEFRSRRSGFQVRVPDSPTPPVLTSPVP